MRSSQKLTPRLVVITGAASGIGRATALAFARGAAELFVCDLPSESLSGLEAELLAAGARRVHVAAVDVGSRAQMADFCELVCRTGTPDVLVNNAGVGLAGGLLATSLDDWQWILNANLWGVVHGCHFFAPRMAARGRGQIVNIASAAGYYNSEAMTAYGTTKFAVIGLSEGFAPSSHPWAWVCRWCARVSSTRRSSPACACAARRIRRASGPTCSGSTRSAIIRRSA
ncbi:MAG: SDR family NAD(P)-dependent oxidoreductase [Pseudomonadota bacterium]